MCSVDSPERVILAPGLEVGGDGQPNSVKGGKVHCAVIGMLCLLARWPLVSYIQESLEVCVLEGVLTPQHRYEDGSAGGSVNVVPRLTTY